MPPDGPDPRRCELTCKDCVTGIVDAPRPLRRQLAVALPEPVPSTDETVEEESLFTAADAEEELLLALLIFDSIRLGLQ